MKKHRLKRHKSHIILVVCLIAFLGIALSMTLTLLGTPQQINSRAEDLPTVEPSPSPEPPTATPSPTPAGAVINMEITLPGISSTGGNIKPQHPTREVAISLFSVDDNAADRNVEPMYTSKATLTYDADPTSGTYTKFVINDFDLGANIPDGDYQIALKTNQTLRNVVKNKPSDIDGIFFKIYRNNQETIKASGFLPGDIMPSPLGNNLIDIADYNGFNDCFGDKLTSSSCIAKERADFDDNGVVDGIDYNIMALSLKTLAELGFPVPSLSPMPTIKPKVTTKPTLTATPAATKTSSGGNPLGGILLFLFIVALIGGGAFYFLKIRKTKKATGAKPTGSPAQPETGTPTEAAATGTTVQPESATPAETIADKEYYVKIQSQDAKGSWLELADDSGQTLGYYTGPVQEGFAKIKGVMKKTADKTYIEISDITSE